jgi:hypothetical protein
MNPKAISILWIYVLLTCIIACDQHTTQPPGIKPLPPAWKWQFVEAGADLKAVTRDSAGFYAVGDYKNSQHGSADGRFWWGSSHGGSYCTYNAVTSNGERLVAVGTDGMINCWREHWGTEVNTGIDTDFHGVCWAVDKFVAVGTGGVVATSPGGVSWSQAPSITDENLLDVLWTGERVIAAGTGGTVIWSATGYEWELYPAVPYWRDVAGIASNDSQHIIVTKFGEIFSSPDCLTWEERVFQRYLSFTAVDWVGGRFITVGTNGVIFTSENGESWTGAYTPSTRDLHGVCGDDAIVAVGDGNTLLWSEDGLGWEELPPLLFFTFADLLWTGNQYIMCGTNGAIFSSSDGMNWVRAAINGPDADITIRAVAWSGERFVAAGAEGKILTSLDGLTWEVFQSVTTNQLLEAYWTGAEFLMGGQRGTLFRSDDGLTWHDESLDIYNSIYAFASSGNEVVAAAGNGSILVKSQGQTWELIDGVNPRGRSIGDIIWSSGSYIAIGLPSNILTSPDGYDWSVQTIGDDSDGWLHALAESPDEIVVVGGSGTVYSTTDRINWIRETLDEPYQLNSVTWSSRGFIAGGSRGICLTRFHD